MTCTYVRTCFFIFRGPLDSNILFFTFPEVRPVRALAQDQRVFLRNLTNHDHSQIRVYFSEHAVCVRATATHAPKKETSPWLSRWIRRKHDRKWHRSLMQGSLQSMFTDIALNEPSWLWDLTTSESTRLSVLRTKFYSWNKAKSRATVLTKSTFYDVGRHGHWEWTKDISVKVSVWAQCRQRIWVASISRVTSSQVSYLSQNDHEVKEYLYMLLETRESDVSVFFVYRFVSDSYFSWFIQIPQTFLELYKLYIHTTWAECFRTSIAYYVRMNVTTSKNKYTRSIIEQVSN